MEFNRQLEADIKVLANKLNARSINGLESMADGLKAEFKKISEFMDKHCEVALKAEFKRISEFIGKHYKDDYKDFIITEDLVLAILDVAADMLIEKSAKEGAGERLFCCIDVYHDHLLSDDEFTQLFDRDEVNKLIQKTKAEQKASIEKAKAETEAKLEAAAAELTQAIRKALTAYAERRNIEMTENELDLMKTFKSQYKSYVFDGLSWCCITPYIEVGHYIIDLLKYAYKNQYEVPDVNCYPPEYNYAMKLMLPKLEKKGFEAMLDMF